MPEKGLMCSSTCHYDTCMFSYLFSFHMKYFNLDYKWHMLYYINLLKITSSFFPYKMLINELKL